MTAGELPPPGCPHLGSQPDAAAATDRPRWEAGVPPFLSPALPPIHRRRPWMRNAAHRTCDQSCAAAAGSKPRGEEWENCGTSTANKRAAKMKALRNADRSAFA